MSCVHDLSIGELALYANGAGDFALECRREIARRDSFWDDELRFTHVVTTRAPGGREVKVVRGDGQPMETTRLSGAALAQRLAEVERERDSARDLARDAQFARDEARKQLEAAQANLSACRQERDHWLTVATQAQGERDAAKAAIATTPRPLPDREAIAGSMWRAMHPEHPNDFPNLAGYQRAQYLTQADHVLELLRPYALAQPANELDYRVSADELADRMALHHNMHGPLTASGWHRMARMVAGLLGVNLRKPDASAHDGEPPAAQAADLPASLGAPKTWEAPIELASERAESPWAELDARLAKLEAVAHAPVPVAHGDEVEVIWQFIDSLRHINVTNGLVQLACSVTGAAANALQRRRAVRSQLEAADLPPSLGTPAPTEPAPFTFTETLRAKVERLEARLQSCVRHNDARITQLDQRLAKVEAVAHEPLPVAHADDVELIWTFISRVAECDVIESARLALKHRQARKVSSDR